LRKGEHSVNLDSVLPITITDVFVTVEMIGFGVDNMVQIA